MGRQALLDDALEHVKANGFSGTTLRQLAEAIGTSHRMLLYHFGSREGLLAALVEGIESAERDATAEVVAHARSPRDAAARSWARLSSPDRAGEERLFFELAALTAQRVAGTEQFAERFVSPWLDTAGASPRARAQMRADIALMRGLLLDLLVTGDVEGVDEAFEQWLSHRTGPRQRERSSS